MAADHTTEFEQRLAQEMAQFRRYVTLRILQRREYRIKPAQIRELVADPRRDLKDVLAHAAAIHEVNQPFLTRIWRQLTLRSKLWARK